MTTEAKEEVTVITPEIIAGRMAGLRKVGIIIAVILVIVGIGIGFNSMENAKLLMSEGLETSAVITDLQIDHRLKKGGKIKEVHVVYYKFTDQNGAEHIYDMETGSSFFESLGVGDEITMRYMPDDVDNHQRMSVIEKQLSVFGVFKRAFILFVVVLLFFEVIRVFVGMKMRRVMAAQTL